MSILSFVFVSSDAQYKPINKLEKVTPKDFQVSSPVVDSNANAVVLADIGFVDFEGNRDANLDMFFKHTERILIRNKAGFDAATIQQPLSIGTDGRQERFMDLEATTYNLEDGVVKETKLDESALFTENQGAGRIMKKFTFPNIKEGSIIEFRYTVQSPFWTGLNGWRFQGKYPILWSRYKIIIPPMINYLISKTGYLHFSVDSTYMEFRHYTIYQPFGGQNVHSGEATAHIWAIRDCPALKIEPYISSWENCISQIRFYARSVIWSEQNVVNFIKPWNEAINELLNRPNYSDISGSNHWLNDDLKKIIDTTKEDEGIVRKIYAYTRDNIASTGIKGITPSQSIKKTFKEKTGNIADINMLLVAMLRNRGIDADPVILSTKENGKVVESIPLFRQYNYLIVRVQLKDKTLFLDASQNMLGFGMLSDECLNGNARVLNSVDPETVTLSSDSICEKNITHVIIYNDSLNESVGTYSKCLGNYASLFLRNRLVGQGNENYVSSLLKSYPSEVKISNVVIDSTKEYDEPLGIRYDMQLKMGEDETLYLNPLFTEAIKTNPFSAAKRFYPLEMSFKKDDLFILDMEIPKGYKVDELPKSTSIRLNDSDGIFEYLVQDSGGSIQLRSHFMLNKTIFSAEDYNSLRDFYAVVVKKEAEQIVFKKIK